MSIKTNSIGKGELASMYFPHLQPHTAWQKLRGLLDDDPALCHLTAPCAT